MPLPATIRVKLSSDVTGSISITPVVVQELAMRELIEHLLGTTGKDVTRIREILLRGTLVSGASRFRWTGWEPDVDGLQEVLALFPDPDPSLAFANERCIRATLRGGRQAIEVPREAAARKSWLEHRSFWDLLMEVVGAAGVAYAGYSYRDRADRYLRVFSTAETRRLRAGCHTVGYSNLWEQIRTEAFSQADLYVVRPQRDAGER